MRSEHFEALCVYIRNLDRLHSVMSKIVILLFCIKPIVLTHAVIRKDLSYSYVIGQTAVYAVLLVAVCIVVWTILLHIYRHDKYVTPEMLVHVVAKQLHASVGPDETRLHNTLLIHQQWRSLSSSPFAYLHRTQRSEVSIWALLLLVVPLFFLYDSGMPLGGNTPSLGSYFLIVLLYAASSRIAWITTVSTTRTLLDAWETESDGALLYTPPFQILDSVSSASHINQIWIRITSNGSTFLFHEHPPAPRARGNTKQKHLRVVRGDTEQP